MRHRGALSCEGVESVLCGAGNTTRERRGLGERDEARDVD